MEDHPILSANLSQDNNTPLYFQLETLIKRCISSGLVKPGDLLPSEAEFCRTFGISRSTVRQAVGELEEEGLVIRHQGKGTFIAEPKLHRRSENIYSFTSEAISMGLHPSSTLVDFDVIRPTEDLRRMLELQSADILVPLYPHPAGGRGSADAGDLLLSHLRLSQSHAGAAEDPFRLFPSVRAGHHSGKRRGYL